MGFCVRGSAIDPLIAPGDHDAERRDHDRPQASPLDVRDGGARGAALRIVGTRDEDEAAASPIFCDTSLDDFVNSTLHIATITSNNEANLKQYRQAVAEAATTEKHIVWTKVTSDCLARVGKPAENALKLYTAGEAPWTACASKGSCKTATPPTADNAAFKKASRMIHAAYNSLD